MLRKMNDPENYAIRATDGNVGHMKDFYFDDEAASPTSTPTSRSRASTRCAPSSTAAIPPIGAVPGCGAAAPTRA